MQCLTKKSKSIKRHVKSFLFKYTALFIFIISYILYYLSLEKCFDGEELCGNNMKWIYTKVFELILSCELISLLIATIIFKLVSKFHLIHLFSTFTLFYHYSHNFYFFDHGMYNFGFFIIQFTLNLIVILFIKLIIWLFKIKNKIIINKTILSVVLFIIYNLNIPNFNCDDWEKGLNNTSIDNSDKKYGCKIKYPTYCEYKVLSKYQDLTKIFGIDCSHKNPNSKKKFLQFSNSPYITKRTKKFGFPYTNKGFFGYNDNLEYKVLKKYVVDNVFDVDKNFNNFSEPEIIVDFSKDPSGAMIIDLKYNDSLSQERKKLENINNPYSNNILLLFFDSVSRVASLTQLNKTLKFVEKFMSYEGGYNDKYPEEKFHSFQFFKYHSFEGRTAGNYPRLYYGNRREANNILRLTKYFKENGYITNYCSHLCQKDNSRTLHNATSLELYDHQMLLCDPNAPRYSKAIRKCLYGKDDVGFLFDYSEQFWRKYKNNRKFSTLIIDSAHEETGEVLKYLDDLIFNYLNSLYNDNLFKDSSIFILSDHGLGIQSIFYIFEFYKIENELPMLYVIINDRKNISYQEQYSYIQENQQIFITAYDIFNTMNNLLYGDKYKYIANLTDEIPTPKSSLGISLFDRIDGKSRKAKNYEFMNHKICI